MKIILKLFLTALAFTTILPQIAGITFHGGFAIALLLALLFAFMTWVVDIAAVVLSAVITVSSLGLALIWLIPLWLLGFWLLPAVALKLLADFMPAYLSVAGWQPAILGGLVMLVIGIVTTNIPTGRAVAA